ncbi:MAG: hypothetical protein OEZ22_15100 [Spirochaetia bacterium]|nr:hypothetical protein [Spirochaetia bacterium]
MKYIFKIVKIVLVISLITSISIIASPKKEKLQEEEIKNNFIGTSLMIITSFIPSLDVDFYEIDYGRKLSTNDYFLIGAHIYRIDAPMSCMSDCLKYPGPIWTYGPIIGYEYVFNNNILISQLLNPMKLDYYDEASNKMESGYMVLFATRVGYKFQFSLGSIPFYFEIAAEFNIWPLASKGPEQFKSIDDKYTIYTFAPAINAGIIF